MKNWLYIGSDYQKLQALCDAHGRDSAVLPRIHLRAQAERLLPHYINTIGGLATADNCRLMLSSVAEKNIYSGNNLFQQTCCLALLRQLRQDGADLKVICDAAAVAAAVRVNFPGWEVNCDGRVPTRWRRLQAAKYHLRRSILPALAAVPRLPRGVRRLIFSWFTPLDCRDGRYRERYFSGVADEMLAEGDTLLVTLPLAGCAPRALRRALRRDKRPLIDLFALATPADLLRTIGHTPPPEIFRERVRQHALCDGIDISPLLQGILADDYATDAQAYYELMAICLQRLLAQLPQLEYVLYPFENQPWERVLCRSVRVAQPQARLTGYMHTVPHPLLVSLFISRAEREKLPLPDRILTTGELSRSILADYYGERRVVVGSSLRLLCQPPATGLPAYPNRVPVLLPVDETKAREMLHKTAEAFAGERGLEIMVKEHPVTPLPAADWQAAQQRASGIRQTTAPVAELLDGCAVALVAETTAVLEVLATGAVAVEIESDLQIPGSRLDYCPEIKIAAGEPPAIAQAVHDALDMPVAARNEYRERAGEFLRRTLVPPSPVANAVFFGEPKGGNR